MFGVTGEVPDGDYRIPFGQARMVREGDDVTIVACGRMVSFSESCRRQIGSPRTGIGCDVIDLRTTSPLDEEAILDSVENTGRLVIVDESTPRCSLASDISQVMVASAARSASLRAPIEMVTAAALADPLCA